MIDLRILLRRLILADLFLVAAFIFFDTLLFKYLPAELQNYQNNAAGGESEQLLLLAVGGPLLAGYAAALVALWKLRRIGRTLLAAVWVGGLIVSAGMPPEVYHPLAALCSQLSMLIHGLIFGLVYFSDLRFEFAPAVSEEN